MTTSIARTAIPVCDRITSVSYTHLDVYKRQVIGSFGLVTVAPFTALCAGILLTRKGDAVQTAVTPQTGP